MKHLLILGSLCTIMVSMNRCSSKNETDFSFMQEMPSSQEVTSKIHEKKLKDTYTRQVQVLTVLFGMIKYRCFIEGGQWSEVPYNSSEYIAMDDYRVKIEEIEDNYSRKVCNLEKEQCSIEWIDARFKAHYTGDMYDDVANEFLPQNLKELYFQRKLEAEVERNKPLTRLESWGISIRYFFKQPGFWLCAMGLVSLGFCVACFIAYFLWADKNYNRPAPDTFKKAVIWEFEKMGVGYLIVVAVIALCIAILLIGVGLSID